MTPKQKSLYWRLWQQVATQFGWLNLPKDQLDEKRRALHRAAGCPDSSTNFGNAALDRYKGHCLALLAQRNSAGPDLLSENGERRRLIWRIRQDAKDAGLDEAYIVKVARDLHVLGCWDELCLEELTNLRNTIHNRSRSKLNHPERTATADRPRRRYTLDKIPRAYQDRRRPAAASESSDRSPVPAAAGIDCPF